MLRDLLFRNLNVNSKKKEERQATHVYPQKRKGFSTHEKIHIDAYLFGVYIPLK